MSWDARVAFFRGYMGYKGARGLEYICICWHPAGVLFPFGGSYSGGVARCSLNHRLLAPMPPASAHGNGLVRTHVFGTRSNGGGGEI